LVCHWKCEWTKVKRGLLGPVTGGHQATQQSAAASGRTAMARMRDLADGRELVGDARTERALPAQQRVRDRQQARAPRLAPPGHPVDAVLHHHLLHERLRAGARVPEHRATALSRRAGPTRARAGGQRRGQG
jgi:hypothetical protein